MKILAAVIGAVALPALSFADAIPVKEVAGIEVVRLAQAQGAWSDGEVRRVNKETKKITVKHGPLANLDMPPMTMVFQVADPAMLDQVQAGDKIQFEADKVDGAYTIMKIKSANQ